MVTGTVISSKQITISGSDYSTNSSLYSIVVMSKVDKPKAGGQNHWSSAGTCNNSNRPDKWLVSKSANAEIKPGYDDYDVKSPLRKYCVLIRSWKISGKTSIESDRINCRLIGWKHTDVSTLCCWGKACWPCTQSQAHAFLKFRPDIRLGSGQLVVCV